jgi:hypothetical protein
MRFEKLSPKNNLINEPKYNMLIQEIQKKVAVPAAGGI